MHESGLMGIEVPAQDILKLVGDCSEPHILVPKPGWRVKRPFDSASCLRSAGVSVGKRRTTAVVPKA
jgi:hypothetical protein